MHRLRRRDAPGPDEQMNLVPVAVEGTSQQEKNDEQTRQDDSPALCEPATMSLCVVRCVRFRHASPSATYPADATPSHGRGRCGCLLLLYASGWHKAQVSQWVIMTP